MKSLITFLFAAALCAQNPDWSKPFPAHRVIGNVYYVGTYDLTSYLITSPQGHIVINTALEDSVPMMRAGIEKLGFKLGDVKILLTTQAHYDHVAALAELKKLTGARLLATAGDKAVLEDGGISDFRFGGKVLFAPIKVDRVVGHGEVIKLGGIELTTLLTPGHTKGSASYSLRVRENNRLYDVLIANMGTINPGVVLTNNKNYPQIADDYARTFSIQKALACDVFLSSHASMYRLHEKYRPGQAYSAETFVDPAGYKEAVARYEKAYLDQLARERGSQ